MTRISFAVSSCNCQHFVDNLTDAIIVTNVVFFSVYTFQFFFLIRVRISIDSNLGECFYFLNINYSCVTAACSE